MESRDFQCPCGHIFAVPTTLSGSQINCPNCDTLLNLPPTSSWEVFNLGQDTVCPACGYKNPAQRESCISCGARLENDLEKSFDLGKEVASSDHKFSLFLLLPFLALVLGFFLGLVLNLAGWLPAGYDLFPSIFKK